MLYIQYSDGRGKGWALVFSTKDSEQELNRFRCLVHAPRSALHVPKHGHDGDRIHLTLFGTPRIQAALMIASNLVFQTPIERIAWELRNHDVQDHHPEPFMGFDNE